MLAYIGPCICQDCLEVMDNVIDLVKQMDFDTTPYYKQTDTTHYLLDNKGLNRQMLLNLGLLKKILLFRHIVLLKMTSYFIAIVNIKIVAEISQS